MAELGYREIGLIEDEQKKILDEIFSLEDDLDITNASEWRQSVLTKLIQGNEGEMYTTHSNLLFESFKPIENNFQKLNLETAIDYVKNSYDVFTETEQINTLKSPELMWTGFSETVDSLLDLASDLNANYDFEISTSNVSQMLTDMSEQLSGSNIKVGDVPSALEIQIIVLDEMQYHEIASMYSTWPSTELMRPMTIQLVEFYDQIDNLDSEDVGFLVGEFKDDLWITDEPSDYLLNYENPDGLDTKSVKNIIKYYFEQLGRLQNDYVNFNGARHAFLDGGEISGMLDRSLNLTDLVREKTGKNLPNLLFNSKNPSQFLHTMKPFDGLSDDIPYQVSANYFTRYQEILGGEVTRFATDPNYAATLSEGKDLYNYAKDTLEIPGFDVDEVVGNDKDFLEKLITTSEQDILETPTQALDELDDAISKADGVDNLNKAKDIINNNPGVFRKIFSVLEKADIGDQVITKAIIPKVLPRIGLAAATGPVGIAYAAYEMALLLSDVGQAAYKAQTTDESFWDNFGEVSDKYSIAYKISKPVYDIILDNLNNDLTEEEDEEILFSFNR